MIFKYFETILL